jgi:hypothetical protein
VLHRVASVLIVVFWGLMTFLLVRSELNPDGAIIRAVPVEHVMRLLFQHEQVSDLRIYSGAKPMGYLHLHPRVDKVTDQRVMDFTGTMHVYSAPQQRHRVSWEGNLIFSEKGEMQRTWWAVTLDDPGYVRVEVAAVSGAPTAHLVVRTRERVNGELKERIVDERDVSMDEAGFSGLVKQVGATGDLAGLLQQPAAQIKPVVKARLAALKFRGEKLETYLVSVEHNGQTYLEGHFSQLGVVLQAKTMLGYTLRTED